MFQPAEEGPSLYAALTGKSWGAKLMIKEGVLADPRPDAVFGLHVTSGLPAGRIGYRSGAAMASADELRIKVTGRQGHAGYPWRTVDPVTTAAQIVLGVQTIVSRRTDLMKSPTVVSISTINGGSRFNIVPETVEMTGTIRTYDADVRKGVHADLKQVAENIAASAGAKAEVEIIELYDPLVNNAQHGVTHGAGARTGGGRQHPGGQSDRRRGRLLVLPERGAGAVLQCRRRAARSGPRRRPRRTTARTSSSTRRRWWSACARSPP